MLSNSKGNLYFKTQLLNEPEVGVIGDVDVYHIA